MVLGESTYHKVHFHWGLTDHVHMVFVSLVSSAVRLQEEFRQFFFWSDYSLSYLCAGILPRRAHTPYLSKPVSPFSTLLPWGILLVAQVGKSTANSGPGLIRRGS
jgi:hypothetical protein